MVGLEIATHECRMTDSPGVNHPCFTNLTISDGLDLAMGARAVLYLEQQRHSLVFNNMERCSQ